MIICFKFKVSASFETTDSIALVGNVRLGFEIQSFACPKQCILLSIECLFFILTQRRIVFVMYLPPYLPTRETLAINELILVEIDKILVRHADYVIVLCGELNRFDISALCHNLVNHNKRHSYDQTELVYILLSDSLSELFDISIETPLVIFSDWEALLDS